MSIKADSNQGGAVGRSGGILYMVATPIGNLGDITQRAIDVLRDADVIFCEDTRVTGKLLTALGIEGAKARLRRLDENMLARDGAEQAIDLLAENKSVAYCSDAGMPAVSDPGQRLVAAAAEAGFKVEVLPGASAVECAFVASGTPATTYYFGGFLPRKKAEQEAALRDLATIGGALIFYESPKRLIASLETIAAVFPTRDIAVCRELTKMHEEVVRGLSVEVASELAAHDEIKGEIAIVIDGPSDAEREDAARIALTNARKLAEVLASGAGRKEAGALLQEVCGISRNDAYDITLEAFN